MTAMDALDVKPYFNLGMRLGEGSGCPVSFKIIETACAAMNGANEEAVALFLQDRIGFYDIYDLVSRAVEAVPFVEEPTLEQILDTDARARAAVRQFLK